MPLIYWDDSLKTNIGMIDAQHHRLIDMINEFYDTINKQNVDKLLNHLIKEMRAYTLLHFNTEEKLFIRYNYPESVEHRNEHKVFLDKVEELEKKLREKKLVMSFEVTNFLKNWIVEHIQGSDQKYTQFLIDKGVK